MKLKNFLTFHNHPKSVYSPPLRFDDLNEINDNSEEEYGNQLLKYINDKDLKDIQLSKKEYMTIDIKSNIQTAEYNCVKKICDPEELIKIDERNANPNILTGKDAVYAFYKLMGLEIEYDEIFAD